MVDILPKYYVKENNFLNWYNRSIYSFILKKEDRKKQKFIANFWETRILSNYRVYKGNT